MYIYIHIASTHFRGAGQTCFDLLFVRRSACLLHTIHIRITRRWLDESVARFFHLTLQVEGPQGSSSIVLWWHGRIHKWSKPVYICISLQLFSRWILVHNTILYISEYIYIMCIACGFSSLFIYVHVIHDVENRWCEFQIYSFLWGKTNQYIGVFYFHNVWHIQIVQQDSKIQARNTTWLSGSFDSFILKQTLKVTASQHA